MKLSLVIPAYNEEQRLGPFLQSIVDYDKNQTTEIAEILVVDDGSQDATAGVAEKYARLLPKIRVLHHAVNQGKGAAVRSGVMAAQGDYVVFMDADGATPIAELPRMVAALAEADIGVGSRWMEGAKT
ncbi:MAG: glycosyltransferase, partial [Patescibacteria group bacterium]